VHKNVVYNYTAESTDPDNDPITYTITWGDGTPHISYSRTSAEPVIASHSWEEQGEYTITVQTSDGQNYSISTSLLVYVDRHNCGSIGYLIDENSDGIYDVFYDYGTDTENPLGRQGEQYIIDSDGDGFSNYLFNPAGGQLTPYDSMMPAADFAQFILLFILLLIGGLMIMILIFLQKRKKQT